jgi:hypothetical protein
MGALNKSDNEVFYYGYRNDWGNHVFRREICNGKGASLEELDPSPGQMLYNHSPDGFEWGYGGSGPAQLALSLLLDATGDKDIALAYYQQFKVRFVVGWGESWGINAEQVRNWAYLRQFHEGVANVS